MSIDSTPLDFEKALKGIEQAVNELERGDLALSESLAAYEKGVRLLGQCQTLLEAADRQVAILAGLNEDGPPQTMPFDATATTDLEAKPTPKSRRTRAGG
ncbi:MAG: exodeoxyribonuclease VII small subunit [Isosphaeraceae bacterium]